MQNFKKIKTFIQKDIFPNMEASETEFEDRVTGKSIIIDSDKKIALVGTTVNYIYTLPGGGVDKCENLEFGITRESKEETGCDIKIKSILGVIDDYRNRDKKHCISYCAVSEVVGEKKDPKLTDEEKENGLHVKWFTKDEAFKILEEEYKRVLNGKINFYNTAYNVVRDYEFFKEYLKISIKYNIKILVTGHKGFIGSYLHDKLVSLGYEVVGFDLLDGDDLMNFSEIEQIIKSVDIVYHIAAQANLNEMAMDFDSARKGLDINVTATQHIALLCAKYNKWLIFASTLCVYGNINEEAEEDSVLPNPSEIYACSKYSAEWIIKGLSKSFGLEYTILRFATIYGAGMRPALGAQIFINQATEGREITVHGTGEQTRTMTYVSDLIEGCVSVLEHKNASINQVINLSTDRSVSALQMANDIKEILGSDSKIVNIPQRKNQTLHEKVSVKKAQKILNWKAKTLWKDGIKEVINNYIKK